MYILFSSSGTEKRGFHEPCCTFDFLTSWLTYNQNSCDQKPEQSFCVFIPQELFVPRPHPNRPHQSRQALESYATQPFFSNTAPWERTQLNLSFVLGWLVY